jgi:hypothetical protein
MFPLIVNTIQFKDFSQLNTVISDRNERLRPGVQIFVIEGLGVRGKPRVGLDACFRELLLDLQERYDSIGSPTHRNVRRVIQIDKFLGTEQLAIGHDCFHGLLEQLPLLAIQDIEGGSGTRRRSIGRDYAAAKDAASGP